ncbi:MAG: hypothetical protein BWZ10_03229 [candidate division BRC1 bacterium ADurb.BinA364]|nr:MAG: hypothetical protein BWZ10_03229 [candidate division BRC1 bacterium ADurb.BinA364]
MRGDKRLARPAQRVAQRLARTPGFIRGRIDPIVYRLDPAGFVGPMVEIAPGGFRHDNDPLGLAQPVLSRHARRDGEPHVGDDGPPRPAPGDAGERIGVNFVAVNQGRIATQDQTAKPPKRQRHQRPIFGLAPPAGPDKGAFHPFALQNLCQLPARLAADDRAVAFGIESPDKAQQTMPRSAKHAHAGCHEQHGSRHGGHEILPVCRRAKWRGDSKMRHAVSKPG